MEQKRSTKEVFCCYAREDGHLLLVSGSLLLH